jgi:hypothetical protein
MSPSDETARFSKLVQEVKDAVAQAIQGGGLSHLEQRDVTTLVSQAVKLYAAVAEELEAPFVAIDETISATEAVVVACALMRAHRLNPFDLAIWSSRMPAGGPSGLNG